MLQCNDLTQENRPLQSACELHKQAYQSQGLELDHAASVISHSLVEIPENGLKTQTTR